MWNSDEFPSLIAQSGPLNGQRWDLKAEMLIGRDESCDIVIPSRQVSRYHVRLSLKTKGVLVEDLGSKNGTYHNGQRLEEAAWVQDGDSIQVALAQQFIFFSSDSTLPLDGSSGFDHLIPKISQPEIQPGQAHRLRLDKRSRRVWVQEVEITPPLSVSQFQLLELLCDNLGEVVSRQELIEKVWGEENAFGISEQALDALVRRLRDRLAAIDPRHTYIVTVRGHGLRLDNSPQD